jgi:hypothetical protein
VKIRLIALSIGLLASSVFGQETLTNDSIQKMAKGGLNESVIIQMINSQPGNYVITPDTVDFLESNGVSEKIVAAMLDESRGIKAEIPAASIANKLSTASPSDYEDLDEGVYRKVRGKWIAIPTERVNWKTAGF